MNFAAGNSCQPVAVPVTEEEGVSSDYVSVVAVPVQDSHGEVPIYDFPANSLSTVPPLDEISEHNVSTNAQTKATPVDSSAPPSGEKFLADEPAEEGFDICSPAHMEKVKRIECPNIHIHVAQKRSL